MLRLLLVQNLFWLADDLQHARETEARVARDARPREPAAVRERAARERGRPSGRVETRTETAV